MLESKINILIADDNIEFSTALQKRFSDEENFNIVAIAKNGMEAIEKIEECKPDVVLLDIIMLNIDGLEVLERINKLEGSKPIVIMMSALNQENVISKAIALGAEYYMVKPFEIDILVKRIKELTCVSFQNFSNIRYINGEKPSLEVVIANVLRLLGVPAHLKGYRYLKDGIILASQNINILDRITKELYPELAKKHKTAPNKIETSIRHAIEIAWKSKNEAERRNIFGKDLDKKTTNSEFIAAIAEKIRLELKIA